MASIKIQEVSVPGCTHCASAKKILEEEIKPQFPEVEIEYIEMLSDEGQQMVQKYSIMASPGIVVNGELFSVGGLDKQKLIEYIKFNA